MSVDLSVEIAGIKMSAPVTTASGTFASGREYSDFVDLSGLGAITAKTVTFEPREGNPPPRMSETPSGMLNSIGLQNPGVDEFVEKDLPFLRETGVPIILSIAGTRVEEYAILASRLSREEGIAALELNISCPNVKEGGVQFGVSSHLTAELIEEVRSLTDLPLIAKLTPNVTSITDIAVAAVGAGADAVSLINTVSGMAIDIERRIPRLAAGSGGLSGPAIRPIAVKMVHDVSKAVEVPIIGMGGIRTGEDAIEFILAGASAVAVGTSNFADPTATANVLAGIRKYCESHNVSKITDLIGDLNPR